MTDFPKSRSWHCQEADVILRMLGTNLASGLSGSDAAAKLLAVGHNEIAAEKAPGPLRLLMHQLSDFMIGLLIIAALISGFLGDLIDTVAIIVIIVLNASVGVFQEYRAQRAIAALREMSAPLARVVRDGVKQQIAARDLVPGDIVMLEAGDVVAADLRLIEATDLGIDESALTGESVPVSKQHEIIAADQDAISEHTNMAFKSTLVTRGRASGVVVATGRATEIGRVADLLREKRAVKTPLQHRLHLLSRRIALIVLAICALVMITGLLQGQPLILMSMTALSLAVAAVPEALPAVITVALGLGARRLSELKALVRRLPAVESLGSVTYICADKTGTLTENRMKLGVIYAAGQRYAGLVPDIPDPLAQRIGAVLALNNDVEIGEGSPLGDPTEVALYEGALAGGFDKSEIERRMPRVSELPFESERQCMITLHRQSASLIALVKGAPERIVDGCVDQLGQAGVMPLDPGILEMADKLAAEGYRVLALADRNGFAAADIPATTELEHGWTFLGLIGLIDPPRAGALEAIRECRSAGIVPVMITGDHPATAHAIASRLEIIDADYEALTGKELAALSDAQLDERVEKVRVYARASPEQKIRIVRALQRKGHFVAMTGDGVNDAPALKYAAIGIAMGQRGTEVAREASEMVLLDDNFATIVAAVHEGRRIFDDIRKFIRYIMTGNSGEIWLLVMAPFLGMPLPLLPLHILWINLVTDGLPGLTLSAEPAEPDIMQRAPRPPDEGIFAHGMGAHILWVGLLIGGLALATQAWALHREMAHWQTMVFTVIAISQMYHCLAIRSERYSLFSIGFFSNPALLLAIAVTILAQLAVIYVPALNVVFRTAPLSAMELAGCFGVGTIVLIVVELEKLARRHYRR